MRIKPLSVNQILEELAQRVVLNVQSGAYVSFDSSINELLRYHRFLLELNAARSEDGTVINFAERESDFFTMQPHVEWARNYVRLFRAACTKLEQDAHYVEVLTTVPRQLLTKVSEVDFPSSIIRTVMDLGPMLIRELELARSSYDGSHAGDPTNVTQNLLSNSLRKTVYDAVIRRFIGSWESLPYYEPSITRVMRKHNVELQQTWSALATGWPFLQWHLFNTTTCVAISVWFGDQASADMLSDVLIKWPGNFQISFFSEQFYSDFGLRVTPEILDREWNGVVAAINVPSNLKSYLTPALVFRQIVDDARYQVIFIAACVFLRWAALQRSTSDVAVDVGRNLLGFNQNFSKEAQLDITAFSFRRLFDGLLKLEMRPYPRQSGYTGFLDYLAIYLDSLSEPPRISGRVNTPIAVMDRSGLRDVFVGVLLAKLSAEPNRDLAQDAQQFLDLPELTDPHSESPDNVRRELQTYLSMLGGLSPTTLYVLEKLTPDALIDAQTERFHAFVSSIIDVIDRRRKEAIHREPLDTVALSNLRSVVERGVLNSGVRLPFFKDTIVLTRSSGKPDAAESAHLCTFAMGGMPKERFLASESQRNLSGLDELLVDHSARVASFDFIWQLFLGKSKQKLNGDFDLDKPEMWESLRKAATVLGAEPVLLLARTGEGATLWQIVNGLDPEARFVPFERRKPSPSHDYICTIYGIDVYAGNIDSGRALLFSAKALNAVFYEDLNGSGEFVSLEYQPRDEITGSLIVSFKQGAIWEPDVPIYEFSFSFPYRDGNPERL